MECERCGEAMEYRFAQAGWVHTNPTTCEGRTPARSAADWLGSYLSPEAVCSVCGRVEPAVICPIPDPEHPEFSLHVWLCANCLPPDAEARVMAWFAKVSPEVRNPAVEEAALWAIQILRR